MSLKFKNLTKANNLRQSHGFRNGKGERSTSDEWNILEWAAAMAGEAGEAYNVAKKIRRGDYTLEEKREHLGEELADVGIYLDRMAVLAGIDLGEAVIRKFNLTSIKTESPIRLSESGTPYVADFSVKC